MNGAQSLVTTLVDAGVTTCFANPGTSEMHFVSALDDAEGMRGVLCLFEGVATGAADGYARMTGRPAATLLHLGPGLTNGMANLHNARRANTPILNIVGDHATDHKALDAPLESDIAALAHTFSCWVGTPRTPGDVGAVAVTAIDTAVERRGVSTLVLRADVSWNDGGRPGGPTGHASRTRAPNLASIQGVIDLLGPDSVIVAGGHALGADGLGHLDRIARATGARLLAETFPARLTRGAGVPAIERLGYFSEQASEQLAGAASVILVDAVEPVSFFEYPGRPGRLVPADAEVRVLTSDGDDVVAVLDAVAAQVAHDTQAVRQAPHRPEVPTGALTADTLAQAIGALLPEDAIVSDEANTSGIFLPAATAGAPRHDLLTLTGGAIGQGLPVAVGAAVACTDRPVLAIEADGSALYTIQSLWTMVREQLDITVLALTNRSYAILNLELARVGATAGDQSRRLLDLTEPDIDLASVATGLGMNAMTVETADDLVDALSNAFATPGPNLIEAVLPRSLDPQESSCPHRSTPPRRPSVRSSPFNL